MPLTDSVFATMVSDTIIQELRPSRMFEFLLPPRERAARKLREQVGEERWTTVERERDRMEGLRVQTWDRHYDPHDWCECPYHDDY